MANYSVILIDGSHQDFESGNIVDVARDATQAGVDPFSIVAIIEVPVPVSVHRGCHYAVAEQALRSEP